MALQLAAGATPREPQAERALRLLQAQVLLNAGDAAGSLQALDMINSSSVERPVMLLRSQAALALRRSAPEAANGALLASTEQLQVWVAEHGQDPIAWEQLAAAYDARGLRLRSMRAGAEARAVLGDLNGAIDRLRQAQAYSRTAAGLDFIEASVVDTRLRQISNQRRQLNIELRGEGRGGKPDPGDEQQRQ
jgi:beta-barrel assembly-enhancing protease